MTDDEAARASSTSPRATHGPCSRPSRWRWRSLGGPGARSAPAAGGPDGACARHGRPMADVEGAGRRGLSPRREEHYDLISALIKSLRGSDPDAGLYWMARLIEAGEDPRYVARRLVILASEDVGMADPHAARWSLRRPPSGRVRRAPGGGPEPRPGGGPSCAGAEVEPCRPRRGGRPRATSAIVRSAPVPAELRDAHYRGAKALGMAWATSILTMTRGGSSKPYTCPKISPGAGTTSRRTTVPRRCSRSAGGQRRGELGAEQERGRTRKERGARPD